ncbi:MAG: cation:dicarboxylase symporter family transporter [Saprospiraceae bacterium]|nr:cation:dicarboxylase symporter family transporter [Candidatus Vicinibacter proximus]MBL7822314.1 cation:dicarboxylase symporter family transporter [Saprospiraceae bacterium]MCC6843066.1 cation:dicarboxylase symporter family transporter [Saprospiraceae bacterium]HRG31964.1 cation:dicarboxylase symporter family transporter [Saprospiraceae bacterium]
MKSRIRKHIKLVYLFTIIIGVFSALHGLIQFDIPDTVSGGIRWVGIIGLLIIGINSNKLTTWIFISMFIGAEIGYDFPVLGNELNVLSKIFIKLIKSIIAPLLFGTLIVGIAGHSNIKQVGRLGWKSLLYFEVVTTVALVIGLIAINISKAGVGIVNTGIKEEIPQTIKQQGWKDLVLHVFPENFIKAISEGQVLQIVVFCLLFAISMLFVSKETRKPFITFAESLSSIMFKFTDIIMYFAPFAVGGAIAYTISNLGIDIMKNLIQLLLTLYLSLIAFVLLVFVPMIFFFKIPIKRFIAYVTEPVTIAFGTASSEAALPLAMENMEKFGVNREVVAFVLPTGLSFNLDGTTLYLSLAAIFVAQAAGIELTLGQQIVMLLTLMLTSKGVAGVARASLVILAATVSSFGLPEWPIAAILGIDALMDMARTAVNTLGNCLATVVIGKWENELNIPTEKIN